MTPPHPPAAAHPPSAASPPVQSASVKSGNPCASVIQTGYKQTEVGVIPEEWEVVLVDDIASVKTGPFGSSLHERDYVREGTPIITVEHLSELGIIHSNLPMVSDADRERLKAYSLKKDDIVFSRVGSVDRNALVSDQEDGWLFSGRLLRIRLRSAEVFPCYLSYHFHDEPFKQRVRSVAVGQTMPSLNTKIIQGIVVIIPPLPEQRAIAEVLSDVDALLAALDRLIAKKRAIKQGAMQQLLTGRTRLPGFTGEPGYKQTELGAIPKDWRLERVGELFSFLSTSSCPRSDLGKSDEIYYIHYGDIHTKWDYRLDFDVEAVPCIAADKVKNATLLADGDLILVDASEDESGAGKGIEVMNLKGQSAVSGLHTIALRQRGNNFADGFKAYIQSMRLVQLQIRRLITGLKVFGISKTNLATVMVLVPPLPEQRAIAAVLSDMDAEIAVLEARRAKTRALKQGMMQELLTGRIRLVES